MVTLSTVLTWVFEDHPAPRQVIWLPGALETPPKRAWILLHGAGGSPQWALEESGLEVVAQSEGAWLFVPEGRCINAEKLAGFLQNPRVWEDESNRFEEFLGQGDDIRFFQQIVSRIRQEVVERGYLPQIPIHLIGFSNGGAMVSLLIQKIPLVWTSATIICALPTPYTNHSLVGWVDVPVLSIHGKLDPLVPWEGGEAFSPWHKTPRIRPSVWPEFVRWFDVGKGLLQPVREFEGLESRVLLSESKSNVWLESVLIKDMGHHWPGGQGRINRRLAGPPSWRLSANSLIADFTNRAESKANGLENVLVYTDPKRWPRTVHKPASTPIS